MLNEKRPKALSDSIPAQKSSLMVADLIMKPLRPRRTPEEAHEWRIEKFGNDVAEYLEGLDRRKLAEARSNRGGY